MHYGRFHEHHDKAEDHEAEHRYEKVARKLREIDVSGEREDGHHQAAQGAGP